jgi:predicted nucleic acid-binding protein
VERPIYYADTSALIALSRIDQLALLTLLAHPVRVPLTVWEEATVDPAKPGVNALLDARSKGLLVVLAHGDHDAFSHLDPGESCVLSAAAQIGASVLLDERKARAHLASDTLLRAAIDQTIGVIGLVLLAKVEGRIPAARPLLDDLIRQDFWFSPALYHKVLREIGEH